MDGFSFVAEGGIEPPTFRLWAWRATTALLRDIYPNWHMSTEIERKGTAFFWYNQIFGEKNTFFYVF